jgi:hypothetical protein
MKDRRPTTISRPKEEHTRLIPGFENVFEERDDKLRDDIAAFRARAGDPTTHSARTPTTDDDQISKSQR